MGKLGTIIKKDTFTLSAFLISVFNCSARKIFSSFRDEYLIKQRLNNIIKCWFLLPHMRRTLLATLHYSTSHNAAKSQFTLACVPDDCNLTQLLHQTQHQGYCSGPHQTQWIAGQEMF